MKVLVVSLKNRTVYNFRGDLIKERQIKGGIYQVIRKFELNLSREEQMKKVEAIYEVVKEQDEY